MAKEDQIIEALGVIKSNIRHIRRRSMRLGRYVNDVLETTANATLPANYVWVFDPQGDKRVSSPAKNLSTEYGVGMAVIVAYNVDTQEDDVLGVDTILAPMEQGSAAAGLNSPQKPASLSTPVSARDIVVGGVFAASSGGLDVRIGAEWHENGYYTDGSALTLTPTATSGKKSLAVVGVNRLTNAATYTLTADRSSAFTLIADGKPNTYAVSDIMTVVAANQQIDWRGAVELKHGDTTINPAKIIALPWLKAVMVGADGVTAGVPGLVPKPTATDNDKTLLGAGTWAFRHLTSTTSTTVTISGGAATIPATTCFVVLAAETGTSDDLDTATVTGAPRIILFQADSGDTIAMKHNTGNVKLNGAADFSLSGDKTLALFWDGTNLADLGAGGGTSSGTLPAFGAGVIKTLTSDVATAGSDRHLIIAAESGTADDLIEVSGLSVGDEVIIRADTGDTITVKHNSGSATDKILLYNSTDIALSGDKTLKLVKTASAKVVQYVDEKGSSSGGGTDLIILQDQKTQNTAGGTFTSGAWRTRDLNTEVTDAGGHCSLSGNQFTLTAGTYRIRASAPASYCGWHLIRLQNITDGTTAAAGQNAYTTQSDTDVTVTNAILEARITIAGSKAFEIQHRCQTTRNTSGFGLAINLTTEVYTSVWIEKEL